MDVTNNINSYASANTAGNAQATPQAKPAAQQAAQENKDPKSLSLKEMTAILQKTNQALAANHSSLKFEIDPDIGRTVVQVVDQETQKVIKQIPSVEMLKLAKALEKMQGVLVSREV